MKCRFIGYFLSLFLVSCAVDYDINPSFTDEPDRIIINGYLNPERQIRIQLCELKKAGNKYLVKGLIGSHVVLKENGIILFDNIWPDSIFTIEHHPQAKASYSIEVSHDNLQTVNAQTYIPEAIHCIPGFSHRGPYWDHSSVRRSVFRYVEMEAKLCFAKKKLFTK